jgi:hypothetical protein
MNTAFRNALAIVACALSSQALAQENKSNNSTPKPPRPIARLIWQDDAEHSVKWSDVTRATKGLSLSAQPVANFPKLDAEQQSFVQMEESNGMLVVGIHDNDNGNFQSGWVALNSGATEEEHGDHSHWYFDKPPTIVSMQLDKNQGNPAHVYNYQGDIFLANDKKNGFTLLSAAALSKSTPTTPADSIARFFEAGGGHITLAAVDRRVCYATWVDREGDNAGRVDVIAIHNDGKQAGYKLQLPSGGLHGATANSGRVFFAPADGICWVDADVKLSQKPESVKINYISLGEDPATGKPLRTGAFTNHGQHVLFTTGTKDNATLCLIDAKSPQPSLIKVTMPIAEGLAWTTPACVRTPKGKQYALMFSDRRGSEAAESLSIVDLDPNNDGKFDDAKVAKSLPVGASKIVGHGGHHEASFSASGRLAFITNPGDGSIWILSLATLEVESKHQVGGVPSRLVAIGG